MDFKPLHDTIILRLDARKTTSAAGIFLGDLHDKTRRGVVVAVGTGKRLADGSSVSPAVNVGDVVLFEKSYASAEYEKVMYFFVKEDQIAAVFEDE